MGGVSFTLVLVGVAAVVFAIGRWLNISYAFFTAYVVAQYIVLGTAWNILGGYTGYVNFGITAFFAIGAYSTVVLYKLVPSLPLPVMVVVGGILAGLVGLGTGYLTLRLRGVFFSIATLALAVVVQTLITNWDFVGGARGAYVLRPRSAPLIGGEYMQYLCLIMLGLGVLVLVVALLLAWVLSISSTVRRSPTPRALVSSNRARPRLGV